MQDSRSSLASFLWRKPSWFKSTLEPAFFRRLLRTAIGFVSVVPLIWLAYELRLNLAAAGFLQLLLVLTVALKVGFWEATSVSIFANCCLNYFFTLPLFAFTISDPKNWVALLVFEVAALIVSRLSAEAQRQATEARNRQRELERIYEVSRQLLLFEPQQSPAKHILLLIKKVFATDSSALFDSSRPKIELLGSRAAMLETEVRAACLQDRDSQTLDGRTWVRVLRFGVRPIGGLALCGNGLTAVTANALASLTAIALERAHSFDRESRAEAERQTEQLRTTVLDALAHEYKTPLTAVRTAASGLLEIGHLNPPQLELVGLIDSETRQLSELTTRLLQMSRLDRADVQLRPQRVNVDDLVLDLMSSSNHFLSSRSVRVEGLDSGVHIQADRELVSWALAQFLDNAAKYSDPASAITIAVTALPTTVRISVHNAGAPIPQEERERIFLRFYRAAGSSHKAAGTGIGLSISKRVAEMHLGKVWVTGGEQEGNTFVLELPRSKMERT